jgi:hypothetical protein
VRLPRDPESAMAFDSTHAEPERRKLVGRGHDEKGVVFKDRSHSEARRPATEVGEDERI